MIVVDVGCYPHPPEESVHRLIDRFDPDLLFGFDPYPDLVDRIECVGRTTVIRRRLAAWTRFGVVPLAVDGITTGVDADAETASVVGCFDLAGFLYALPDDGIVLKLDCEGAEYPLLARIRECGIDERLALVLVEWHPPETSHGLYDPGVRAGLRCPVEDW